MPTGVDVGDDLGLAPPFPLRGFEGSLSEYVEQLHWQYRQMTDLARINLWGKPLIPRGEVCADGRDKKFWHIITEAVPRSSSGPHYRQLSLARAAVLGQAWQVLELLAAEDIRAVWWREGWHAGMSRVFVTTVDFRLVVVLEEVRGYFRLVTVYPVGRRKRSRVFWRAARAWESGACSRKDTKHPKWRLWTGGQRPPSKQLAQRGKHR